MPLTEVVAAGAGWSRPLQMPEQEEKPSQIEPHDVFSPDQILPPQAS